MFSISVRSLTAVLLSLVLLLTAPLAALAEDPGIKENADIEESMVSGEGEAPGSLAQTFRIIQNLLKDEDMQAILKNEDVRTVTAEITFRVLMWLVQNRPVTMKILVELGISETELKSIEKIWDSSERVADAYKEYLDSEDGKQLMAEFEAVRNDPEILGCVTDFRDLLTSGDLKLLLVTLKDFSRDTLADSVLYDGPLSQEAEELNLERSDFIGKLIFEILHVLEQSDWAQSSLPKLADNKNLWLFLHHLSTGNPELNQLVRQEFVQIIDDEEIMAFLQKTLWEAYELYKSLDDPSSQSKETESRDTIGEEVAP